MIRKLILSDAAGFRTGFKLDHMPYFREANEFPHKYSDKFGRLQLADKTAIPYVPVLLCVAFVTASLTMACRRREVLVSVTDEETELLPV